MSCSSCGSSNCSGGTQCCGQIQGNSCNAPFYTCAPACAEDHTEKIVINCLSASIKVANPWNIPGCGLTAVLVVNGLKAIPIGSNLWSATYGYFEVVAFDPNSSQVTVKNNCVDGNAAAGTAVPACSEFVVTTSPCVCDDTSDICVAIDFTAPAIGVPLDITVSTTQGLTAGDTVQIGSGIYFVQEIKVNNVITIINQGSGITPGTSVIALDADGNFQYCLSIISVSPCDREQELEGAVLICGDNEVPVPLQNTGAGRVVMSLNNVNSDAAYRPLDSDVPICTELTTTLNFTAGSAGPYVIDVISTAGISLGDQLILDARSDRYTVTIINGPTQLTGQLNFPAVFSDSLPPGTSVCQIGCCEELRNDLECVVQGTRLSIDPALYGQAITMANPGGGTGAEIYEVELDSNVIQFIAPDTCPGSTYHVRAELQLTGLVDMDPFAAGGEAAILSCELQADWDNNPGVGGRFNWTEAGNDGVDISGIYPASTLNAMWATLQITNNVYPITYHGAYVIADTLVLAGSTITLRLNFKAIQGENIPSTDVRSVGVYLIGNLVIHKVT